MVALSLEQRNPRVFPIEGVSLRSGSLSQTDLRYLAVSSLTLCLGRVVGVALAVVAV